MRKIMRKFYRMKKICMAVVMISTLSLASPAFANTSGQQEFSSSGTSSGSISLTYEVTQQPEIKTIKTNPVHKIPGVLPPSSSDISHINPVQTGDENFPYNWSSLFIVAVAVLLLANIQKKREGN